MISEIMEYNIGPLPSLHIPPTPGLTPTSMAAISSTTAAAHTTNAPHTFHTSLHSTTMANSSATTFLPPPPTPPGFSTIPPPQFPPPPQFSPPTPLQFQPPFPSATPTQFNSVTPLNIIVSIKLTQENYLTWKAQILPLIHGYKPIFLSSFPSIQSHNSDQFWSIPDEPFLPFLVATRSIAPWLAAVFSH